MDCHGFWLHHTKIATCVVNILDAFNKHPETSIIKHIGTYKIICDWICEKASSTHIQFYAFKRL